jgi:hypothetical protein
MSKSVQECLQIVQSAKKDVNQLLTGTEFVHVLLEVNQLFRRLEMRFEFMGGVVQAETATKGKKFPPITNFMGEKIEVAQKITSAELNPKQAELEKLREKVQKLYGQIRDLQPPQVLHAYSLPEDQVIIRGVAKTAGVEGYNDREINAAFIEDIQMAVEEREEQLAKQREIDKSTQKPAAEEKVLTQADIDADADLIKWKAKPGDLLTTDRNGKKIIKKQKP